VSAGFAVIPRVAVTVRSIEVMPLRIHLSFHRTLSKGAVSSAVDTDWVGNPVLVCVESDDGVVGVAQVRPPTPWLGETTNSIVASIQHYYGPALLGTDVAEREATMGRLEALLPGNTVALAALDIAIHDLLGKTYGMPIYALLGGACAEIPLDWSVSLNPRPAIVAEATRAVSEFGIRTVCLKVGPSDHWREDVATFREVRREIGTEVEIGMDPNEGYDLATMLRVARSLEDDDIAYLEQPLRRHDLEGLCALRGQVAAPVLVDETAIGLAEAYRAVKEDACDAIVLKLWKSGGFTNTRKMAILAEAAGVGTTLGGVAQGSVLEAAACAHLYASIGRRPMAAEFVLGLNVVDSDPIAALPDELIIRDGRTSTPTRPGLGVDVDMNAARSLALARHVIA
jgi:L-alanine-DL-glutamate epimerase-like enolase superfamily enzyme